MSAPRSGFIVHATTRVSRGRAVVQLFGRLASGEPFLVEDDRFEPYFYVDSTGLGVLEDLNEVRTERGVARSLSGAPVHRVTTSLPGNVRRLRARAEAAGGEVFESDIRLPARYLIDHGIRAGIVIEGEAEGGPRGLLRFLNPRLQAAAERVPLSILSLDIETTPDAARLLSVALVGAGADEVHWISDVAVAGAREHPDEAALLAATAQRLREIDPDVLTGWNVIDFDLRVLSTRAAALGVDFELGRDTGAVYFYEGRLARQPRAEIVGRQVLDAMWLVRSSSLSVENYKLDTVARAVLGRGKLLSGQGMAQAQEIERLAREDPAAFVAYNREDACLVLEILEREGLLELAVERSLLCGMALDRVGASIASFDRLYLSALLRRGRVAPSVRERGPGARVQGGAVLESAPGLFRNVAVYDFKSLYPSLIRSFNLDPLAHAEPGPDPIIAPNGAAFSRGDAILPEILEQFFARRAEAKRRGDRHADLAIKIMMNAFFGVLGAPSCRFFDPEIANAITGFGQQTLRWTRDGFEAEGFRVLYGDTDSVFVALDPEADPEEARGVALELRGRVQRRIVERLRERYSVEPHLELELERLYTRFLQPRVRGGQKGSKKRYAGLVEDRVEVVGLEAVRSDWPALAGRLQRELLTQLFHEEPVLPCVRAIAASLLAGDLDHELVFRKRLRKGSADRYTATTPPHIQAARKAEGRVGSVVHYVISRSGPEPVLPDEPFPGEIDYGYYIEKVLRPIADAILCHVGHSFDEALGRPRQLSLL